MGVVIVAAGRSSRVGGDLPKQYIPLAGVPVLLRAVRPFASHPDVSAVVVVLSPSEAGHPPQFLRDVMGEALVVVPGGRERADSVAAGLRALSDECRVVLVHDGARPFVDRAVIDAVIAHARSGEGAIAAVPVSDTIKEVADADATRIVRTVPRERLWRAQTPQGFPRALLEAAYTKAGAGASAATDEAALVEAVGGVVRLVPDSPRNMKITTRDDLAVAEALAVAQR